MIVVVGSVAVQYQGVDFGRNPQDYDLLCTKAEFTELLSELIKSPLVKLAQLQFSENDNKAFAKFIFEGKIKVIEVSFVDVKGQLQESDKQIYDYCHERCKFSFIGILGTRVQVVIAPLYIIHLMKVSHRFKKNSVHFDKTRKDIKNLEEYGVYYPTFDADRCNDMLDLREKLTYTNSLPKLNTTKQEFFTDSVPYKYDHDTIHEAVKHLDKPAYVYYIKDGEQVMCSEEKFFKAPEIVRLYGVLEESYVLALERAVIPFNTDRDKAFKIALEKVCTSITSGWFREYAWDHYDEVMNLYHPSYVEKFTIALEAGKIKPFKENL